jgi:aldehyde:ferredoxin oxidoreductase
MTAINQNYMACMNALGLCKFIFLGRIGPSIANKWTRLVMGWDMSLEEFMQVGDRLYNLKRLFNVKLGINRKNDNLPKRILNLALKDGGTKGHLPDIDRLLPDYYDARGWDEHGIPKLEKIDALGLNHLKSFLDK